MQDTGTKDAGTKDTGSKDTERPRSIRAIKAGCRVALLSQLDRVSQARVIVRLEELVQAREDVDLGPIEWFGPRTDTLVLFSNGDVIAGVVIHQIVMTDPLILGDKIGRSVALDLMWQHLQGVLVGKGISQFFFSLPDALPEWKALIDRDGFAEEMGGTKIAFYRKDLLPLVGG